MYPVTVMWSESRPQWPGIVKKEVLCGPRGECVEMSGTDPQVITECNERRMRVPENRCGYERMSRLMPGEICIHNKTLR